MQEPTQCFNGCCRRCMLISPTTNYLIGFFLFSVQSQRGKKFTRDSAYPFKNDLIGRGDEYSLGQWKYKRWTSGKRRACSCCLCKFMIESLKVTEIKKEEKIKGDSFFIPCLTYYFLYPLLQAALRCDLFKTFLTTTADPRSEVFSGKQVQFGLWSQVFDCCRELILV